MALGGPAAAWGCAAVLGVTCATVLRLVNEEQPGPYMDEIFHVPQARNYCHGNYSHWDPMITTLPGLYVLSVLWVEPVARLLSLPPLDLCTTSNLRAQNAVFIVLNFLVLYWLLKRLHKSMTTSALLLSSLSLSCLPVLFFSSLLYYTDAGSAFFVLAAYALSLSNHHLLAAFLAFVAIVFRQTNVLWMLFIAGEAFIRTLQQKMNTEQCKMSLLSLLTSLPSLLPHLLLCLPPLWPYILLSLVFLAFLAWNGSVVVGDKTHHTAHLHLPQIFYFVSFSAFFSTPYLLGSARLWRGFLNDLRKLYWILALLCTLGFGLFAVHYFTYAHPYLLSDNRHYPFYIWKGVFRRHEAVKYWLVPAYSITAVFFIDALLKSQSQLWVLLFSALCVLALVPQKLLEFRYFIIPHLLLRLHLPPPSLPSSLPLPLLLEAALSFSVNALTVWMFLYRPFKWPNSEDWQRFMW